MGQHRPEHSPVALPEPGKAALEAHLQGRERIHPKRCRTGIGRVAAILDVSIEPHDKGRNECSRERIACQHGEDDRFRQGNEEVSRHAGQEKHRHEHDADAKSRNESRKGDLLRPVEDRLDVGLAQCHLTVNIFDFNRGVVHQDAYRQGQSSERHEVDGLAESTQDGKGSEHRKGNREGDDEGAPPGAEKQQNHDRRQCRRNHALFHHSVYRRADEKRLVGEFPGLEFGGQPRQDHRHGLFYPFHHAKRRSRATLVNGEEHAAHPVQPHHVLLRLIAVVHLRHIAHADHRAVYGLDGKIV